MALKAKTFPLDQLSKIDIERIEKAMQAVTNTKKGEGFRPVNLQLIGAASVDVAGPVEGLTKQVFVACRNLNRKSSYVLIEVKRVKNHEGYYWETSYVRYVTSFRAKKDLISIGVGAEKDKYKYWKIQEAAKIACMRISEDLFPNHKIAVGLLQVLEE